MDDIQKTFLFREVNERIAELLERAWPSASGDFLCECDGMGCTRRVTLALADYRTLRRHGVGVLARDCVRAMSRPCGERRAPSGRLAAST